MLRLAGVVFVWLFLGVACGDPSDGTCPDGTFSNGAECVDLTACNAGEYEAVPPTPTSDRECKPGPFLTSLGLSAGTVTPVFTPDVFDYTTEVGLFAASVTVTPTAVSPDATITVDGVPVASGADSGAITLALGPNPIAIEVSLDGRTETYTVVVDRAPSALQQAYGKASNTDAEDRFGFSVSIFGDTLAVGAPYERSGAVGIDGNQDDNSASGSGAVYVFIRSGTTWTQQAYIKAPNTGVGDRFGSSVSLFGDTLAVSTSNEDSNATGVDGDMHDNSAPESGAVFVFTRSGTTWTQQAYLKASNTDANDEFGSSISLHGDTLVVGARQEDSSATGVNGNQNDNSALQSGAVYVFTRSGTTWTQQAYLKASNTDANDNFGQSVSLFGDTLAVGAQTEGSSATGIGGNQNDNSALQSGAVYVFTRSGSSWTQQAYLKASNAEAGDMFGFSVSLYGDTLAVGALAEDSSAVGVGGDQSNNAAGNSGAVYVFSRSGTFWTQQAYLKPSHTAPNKNFGYSVSLFGDTLAVAAPYDNSGTTGINGNQADTSATFAGAAYVFTRSGTTWSQQAYVKASNTDAGDVFGHSVSFSGDTLAVGALENSSATGINGDQSDNTASNSGAVYVFR